MTDSVLYSLFIATSVLYAAASAGYFVFVANGRSRARTLANALLMAAAVCHLGFVVRDWGHYEQFGHVRQMLSTASLAIAVAFLVAARAERLSVLGAFITPIALLLYLLAGLGHSVPEVPADVRSALLPAHVLVNILGVSAFALAFAVAVAYLIQERLLRRRRLSGLFQRLPPLDVLDSLGLKLLLIGFPLFTAGTVSGAIWARQLAESLSAAQVMGLVSWAVFGVVLLLRVAAGWQGRRAAIGTLVGCICTLAVVASYAFRTTEAAGGMM